MLLKPMPVLTAEDREAFIPHTSECYAFEGLQPGEAYAVPYSIRRHNYLRSRVVWASIRYGRRFRWKWRKGESEIIIWCEKGVDTEAGEA